MSDAFFSHCKCSGGPTLSFERTLLHIFATLFGENDGSRFTLSEAIMQVNLSRVAAAYATHTYPGNTDKLPSHAVLAVDGNADSAWNAGGATETFGDIRFTIDFWGPAKITSISATPAQSSAGVTRHVVKFREPNHNVVGSPIVWEGNTKDGVPLKWSHDGGGHHNIRWIEITTTKSQGWASWKEIDVHGEVQLRNKELNHFGYFFAQWNGVDYFEQQKSRANMLFCEGGGNGLVNRIKQARDANMNGLVALKKLFAVKENGDIDAANWNEIKEQLKLEEPSILAFVQPDEPYWRQTWTKEQLEKVASIVKMDFPDTPVAVYFAYPSVIEPSFEIPKYHDWFSVDRYLQSNESESFQELLNKYYSPLKNRMTSDQKFFVIGDGYYEPTGEKNIDANKQYSRMIRAREFYSWGVHTRGVVMYFPFCWPKTSSGVVGVTNLKGLRRDFDEISTRIRRTP